MQASWDETHTARFETASDLSLMHWLDRIDEFRKLTKVNNCPLEISLQLHFVLHCQEENWCDRDAHLMLAERAWDKLDKRRRDGDASESLSELLDDFEGYLDQVRDDHDDDVSGVCGHEEQ